VALSRPAKAEIPRLHLIADRGLFTSDDAWLDALVAIAPAAHRAGALLHLRDKSESRRHALLRLARAHEALAQRPEPRPRVAINGTTAEADALGADAVHWPEALIPETGDTSMHTSLCGASVHDHAAAQRTAAAGAHYILFSPIWKPTGKTVEGVGTEALRELCAATELPVIALGGITPARVAACLDAGAHGVAVLSFVMASKDPARAIAELHEALNRVSPVPPRGSDNSW